MHDIVPAFYFPGVPTPCIHCDKGFTARVVSKGVTMPKVVHGLHGMEYIIGRKVP